MRTTAVAREEEVGGRSATRPAIRAVSRAPSDDDDDYDGDDACACLSIKMVGPLLLLEDVFHAGFWSVVFVDHL